MNVSKCALTVYTFTRLGADPCHDSAREYLDLVWRESVTLGMSESFAARVPTELPAAVDDTEFFGIVAGRSSPPGEALYRGFAFHRHDVLGSVMCLAPNRADDKLATWGGLHGRWMDVVGGAELPESVLGEVLVFTAIVLEQPDDGAAKDLSEVRDAMGAAGLDLRDEEFVTICGFMVGEGVESTGRRVMVVLASAAADDALAGAAADDNLTQWVWWRNEGELAPFGQYLVNASKLRYEKAACDEWLSRLREASQQTEAGLKKVVAEHALLLAGDQIGVEALLKAQGDVLDVQVREKGYIEAAGSLRELRNTVRVAAHNMALAVPLAGDGSVDGPGNAFTRDRNLAEWLQLQIDTDLEYSQATLERVRSAQALTDLRLKHATERHQRDLDRIVLVQGITSAFLLGALSIVTWLGLEGPRRRSLAVPMALAFGAFLLAFPLAAAHRYRQYSRLDQVAVVVFGGLLVWVATAALWHDAGWYAAFAALPGALAGWTWCTSHDRPCKAEVSQ